MLTWEFVTKCFVAFRRDLCCSDIEASLVFHKLAVFQVSSQDSQVHWPAVTRDAPVLVLFGPTSVVETHSCRPVSFRCQFAPTRVPIQSECALVI